MLADVALLKYVAPLLPAAFIRNRDITCSFYNNFDLIVSPIPTVVPEIMIEAL